MANRDYENRRFMGEDRERWMGRDTDEGFRGEDTGRRYEVGTWQGGQGYAGGRGTEDYGRTGGDYGRGMREDYGRTGGDYGRSMREDYGRMGGGYQRDLGGRYGEDWRGRGPDFYGSSTGSTVGGQGYDYSRGYGVYGQGARGMGEDYRRREDERGPFERLGDRMREGFRRMTGRSPKAYTRADDRIRDDIYDRLMRGWVNAEDVEVQVKNGEVTLVGSVEVRQDKYVIEDIAGDVLGVKDVHNQLRVGRREEPQTAATPVQRPARS